MLRSVLLNAPTTLIAMAAAAPAGAVVLGPDSGVSAMRTGDKVDVTFTPAALAGSRLKAGGTVELMCTVAPPTPPGLELAGGSGTDDRPDHVGYADGPIGADGVAHLTLTSGDTDSAPGTLDSCDVERVRHLSARSTVTNTVARVPLTAAGATYVDETVRATALRHLLQKAHAATGYQPVAALGAGVVAMDAPGATPPAGQTGYWTDGTHAAVATLSAAGRRLAIQDLGNYVLRSNVFDQMDPYGFDDITPADVSAGTGTSTSSAGPKSPDADKKPSPYRAEQPLMPADGIRATVSGRRVTVRFTGKAAKTLRALRGRRLSVLCLAVPRPRLFPSLLDDAQTTSSGVGVLRVPAHGDAVRGTLRGGTGDVCYLVDDEATVAMAGGTAAGKGWIQDLETVMVLLDGEDLDFAAPGGKSYLPTAQLVAAGKKQHYVAMSGPDGAVPVGRVGVWTDGARQAAVAVTSPSGRRFLVVDEGDGVGRTNLLSIISSLFLGATFGLEANTSSGSSSGSFVG